MKRVLVAVLVIWGATLIFPSLREGMHARVTQVASWMGMRLEGPASPITNRYRRLHAESDLSKTSRLLVLQRNQGHPAPEPHELGTFLTRHEIGPRGIDPWGVPYRIAQEADSVAIMSAGPDRTFGTGDDLVVRLRYPRRDRPARPARPARH